MKKNILFKTFSLIIIFEFLINFNNCKDLQTENFDVREKFRDCYNDGSSSLYNNTICYTNWPIQFAMMITDKICIKKGINSNSVLSSMNINTCMKLDGNFQNCRDLKNFYNDTMSTLAVVNETIKFFNEKGIQYLEDYPYIVLKDDDGKPGFFPPCLDFNSSIGNITLNTDYEIYDETNDSSLQIIKQLIYEEGPILAFLDTKAIYIPEEITVYKHDGLKFLRVIGWRTLQGKTYWIFSYTLDEDWGLNNYALIAMKDYSLRFINFSLN